jgi:hypothetical protein
MPKILINLRLKVFNRLLIKIENKYQMLSIKEINHAMIEYLDQLPATLKNSKELQD